MIVRQPRLSAALLLAAAVALMAPHVVTDADALSRLAMGRLLWQQHMLPASDPFTFSAPGVRFGNPEWLGDLGLYAVHSFAGEHGLALFVIAVASLGYALALWLATAFGARATTSLALLLCTLPAAAPRIAPRNDIHLLWLVPLFGLLAWHAPVRRGCVLGMAALAWLWASLHSSFLLGAVLLAAAIWETPRRSRGPALVLLAIYPALPWLGLSGRSTYDQLLDHLVGAPVYRALLSEWMSPLTSGGVLAILPLYVFSVLGTLVLWSESQRIRPVPLALFVVGCVLAYSSRRFLLVVGCMIVPPTAAAFDAWSGRTSASVRRFVVVIGTLCVLSYCALGAASSARRTVASVFEREAGPAPAVRFMADHAPAGSRIANAFDDGPWLLWLAGASPQRLRHYLDPRNNLGSAVLARYVYEILADPSAFEREVQRLGITLTLLPVHGVRTLSLLRHLVSSREWRLAYWDGRYVLYAREADVNRELLDSFGYRVLRPTLDLRYLEHGVSHAELARDLTRLERQSTLHADVIRAYLALRDGDRERVRRAAEFLQKVWPRLPDAVELGEALRARGAIE